MSGPAMDPRWTAGKHLTLTDNALLPLITRVPEHIVPALGLWFGFVQEARSLNADPRTKEDVPDDLLPMVDALEDDLIHALKFRISVKGEGRRELIEAIQALQEQELHRDAAASMAGRADPPKRGLQP